MTEPRARSQSTSAAYLLLFVLAAALFLPRLGSFGFWDPYEIRIADAARTAVDPAGANTGVTQASISLGRPPAVVALVSTGFRLFGIGEWGGRLPIALTAVLAVLACFYAGSGLIRRRGALIGSFILATTPAFLLGARQLTTNAPLLLGTALAVGGLARAFWPREGTPFAAVFVDVTLGLAGLVIGLLSGGLLVGLMAPIVALALALATSSNTGSRRVAAVFLGVIAVALGGAGVVAWSHARGYSPLLGGVPHPLLSTVVFTNALKQVGFGLFPWIALLPMAGIHALQSTTSEGEDAPEPRVWFGRVLLVAWLASLYCAATLQAAALQELLLPAAPVAMLLVGHWLDDVLDSDALLPFAGLTAALGAVVLGRDFFVFPEQFVGVHMLDTIRWPGPLTNVPYVLCAYAVFFGAVIGFGVGAPLTLGGAPDKQLATRRWLLGGAVAASLVMSLVIAHWVIPECSKHLSSRDLYGRSKQLDPNAPVGQYHFNASGAAYYTGGKNPVTLPSLEELFRFLGRQERVFVMAGIEELPSIDQFAKQKSLSYYLVDDSSSRYLMLSNRLGPGEQDKNPLRLYVSDKAPTPPHAADINFNDKVQLIGWDLPAVADKGQDLRMRLYFKVLAPVAGSYKIFVHLDGSGTRINGDHAPLEGRFPTSYWVPGFYITDEHVIKPDRNLEMPGQHTIFMGLWQGNERMKVLAGPSDGDNRAKLGTILIK